MDGAAKTVLENYAMVHTRWQAQFFRPVALTVAVGMSEIPVGSNPVPNQLLDFLGLGKTSLLLPRPDQFTVDTHLEHAACPGNQGDLSQLGIECGQQFLRQPARTQ
jgi:hypothetical protein